MIKKMWRLKMHKTFYLGWWYTNDVSTDYFDTQCIILLRKKNILQRLPIFWFEQA